MVRLAIALLFVLTTLPTYSAAGGAARVDAIASDWYAQQDSAAEAEMHSPFRVAQPSVAPPLARGASSGGDPTSGSTLCVVRRDLAAGQFGSLNLPRPRPGEIPPRTCEALPYHATAPPPAARLI